MAETKMDLEIFPKLTITEETAETCTWLLTQYLEANPEKTVKVITKPGGDGFVRKVEIVPEWKEKPKKNRNVQQLFLRLSNRTENLRKQRKPMPRSTA